MSPDVQYGFDHQVHLHYISGDVYHYFMYYANFDVDSWYDNLDRGNDWRNFIEVHTAESKRLYRNWYAKDNSLKRGGCVNSGLRNLAWLFGDIELSIVNNGIRLLGERGFTDEQIVDQFPEHLSEIVSIDSEFAKFNGNATALVNRAHNLGIQHLKEAIDYERDSRARRETQISYTRKPRLITAKEKRQQKAARKVLLKSTNMLTRFTDEVTTKMFISGKEISVEGKKFDFRVKRGSLMSAAHGGVDLLVCDKAGNKLVDLCWYVDGTPAPEQVVALMLHAAHGDENEIIKTGNIIRSHEVEVSAYQDLLDIRGQKQVMKTPVVGDVNNIGYWMERHMDEVLGLTEGTSARQHRLHDRVKDQFRNRFPTFLTHPIAARIVAHPTIGHLQLLDQ